MIKVAADAYYNDKQVMSDQYYDLLMDRLRSVKPDSKALQITGAVTKGKKVRLPYWMGSMDKVKTDEKVVANWIKEYPGPYLISDKLDGVSGLMINDNGLKLYTRGDGEYGQDITHLIDLMGLSNVRLPKDYAVRGELVIAKKDFKKYEKEMANARALIIGVVNTKAANVNKRYANDISFVTYEVIYPNMRPLDQFASLKKYGLPTARFERRDKIDIDSLSQLFEENKKSSIYEIDGLIITDDKKHARDTSGNPPYSFAYKGLSETADVKVLEIIWTPSVYGTLIPRIRYEKVTLSQAELEYATGFNARFIVDNGLGKGAVITLIRSGDVIPYILGVVKAVKPGLPYDYEYEWDENEVDIILTNPGENETVLVKILTKFVRTIGVKDLSEGIVTKMVKAGFITVQDIIQLSVEDLLEIPGFQKRLAQKTWDNINSALDDLNILDLMVASNQFGKGFGQRRVKKILNVYPDIVDRYDPKEISVWKERINDIEGFDTITTDLFLDGLTRFMPFYESICEIVEIKPYVPAKKKGDKLQGMNVVFTGIRRMDLVNLIKIHGGEVSDKPSKKTTIVVYAKEGSASYVYAQKNGIKTMTVEEFEKYLDKALK